MMGIETAIRRGDRVLHKDGTEGVAMTDEAGGLFVVQARELGLLEWWATDVTVLQADATDAPGWTPGGASS